MSCLANIEVRVANASAPNVIPPFAKAFAHQRQALLLIVMSGLLGLTACGGAQRTSGKEMSAIARGAVPPPQEVVSGAQVERKVSTEAKTDFAEAMTFFAEKDKQGWTPETCKAAAERFRDVASSHSKLVEAYFNAGVAYQKCGDGKSAEAMYKKAIELNPSHAQSLANLGEIYYRGGNDSVGRQYFEQAIKANGMTTAARNNLAWILYTERRAATDSSEQKRLEKEAEGHLSRVLAVDNDNVVAYTLLALFYMEGAEKNKSRLDMAKLLLDEGRKRNDKYAPLFNASGLLNMKKANVGVALEQFRKAVELDGDFIEARMNVAQLVLSFRKYEEAEQHFRHVLGKGETAKDVRKDVLYDATVGLGVALRGQKKIDEAQARYEEAMQLDANRGDAFFNMGLLWKDFRTNDADVKVNREAYVRAKKYFTDFVARRPPLEEKLRDAKDYVEDCDKIVAQLDQLIQQMEASPPAPTSQPVGAGDGTTAK